MGRAGHLKACGGVAFVLDSVMTEGYDMLCGVTGSLVGHWVMETTMFQC